MYNTTKYFFPNIYLRKYLQDMLINIVRKEKYIKHNIQKNLNIKWQSPNFGEPPISALLFSSILIKLYLSTPLLNYENYMKENTFETINIKTVISI